jgi:hypothetical protein
MRADMSSFCGVRALYIKIVKGKERRRKTKRNAFMA